MAQSPLLRPWPFGEKKPTNIGDFVSRISREREGFRNVPSEAQLLEEVKAQSQETPPLEDEDMSESEDETDASKTISINAAREEIFMNLDIAHNATVLCLEFVSLLLSKEIPGQATATLSPELRDLTGIGTLGASKLKDSNLTQARIDDDTMVAGGWRLINIDTMVNSVMESAEKLEKEMALEAKYWDEILAVSEKGWAICSLPNEPHTLGVRFGFSEAAPEFRNSSIAPLRRNDEDGSIWLAIGSTGAGSQRVRATIVRDGEVIGMSRLPRRPADDAPLQDRVLEARNTIFSQELWHEINREARTLLAMSVNFDQSSVTWDFQPGSKLVLTLEDLSDTESPTQHLSHNWVADSAALCLHILLSSVHRQNYTRRTHPQTLALNRTNPNPIYMILRFLIARVQHITAYMELHTFLEQLMSVLRFSGLTTPSYMISTGSANSRAMPPRHASKAENFVNRLISGMDLSAEIIITPEVRLQIRGLTQPGPYIGQRFMVQSPPANPNPNAQGSQQPGGGTQQQPQQQQQNQQQAQAQRSFLDSKYPPSPETYNSLASLTSYIMNATARALASHLAGVATRRLTDEMRDGAVSWSETKRGPFISVEGGPAARNAGGSLNLVREDQDQDPRRRLALRLDAQWVPRAAMATAQESPNPNRNLPYQVGKLSWFSDGTGSGAGLRLEDILFAILAGTQ